MPPKVLVFMLAYNAEKTIESVFKRIPESLNEYDTSVLVIDDGSTDDTFAKALAFQESEPFPFDLTVLRNPTNQGFGGNVKIGMFYALKNGFDAICLIHGDGQYAPEDIPKLVKPLLTGEADVVFGSRMMSGFSALKGGMPLYKFIGNKILTWLENRLLGANLSEYHTGMRLYSARALKKIPFHLNANDFHFDTEIIIQLLNANCRIMEFPVSTFYGDEKSHVNGLRYAKDVSKQAFLAWAQRWNLCYQRRYDVAPKGEETAYKFTKARFSLAHQAAIDSVPDGATVLDLACRDAVAAKALKAKGCRVTGIDLVAPEDPDRLDAFIACDLDSEALPVRTGDYDIVLLLDVIGHLKEPEDFLESLHASSTPDGTLLVTAGNIGFVVNRLQLLLGYFNYGKRGILDSSHTRLFTFQSLARTLAESGFEVEEVRAVPAPFELAFGDNWLAGALTAANRALIHISKGLFGYRIFIRAKPRPTLESLLEAANPSGQDAGGGKNTVSR